MYKLSRPVEVFFLLALSSALSHFGNIYRPGAIRPLLASSPVLLSLVLMVLNGIVATGLNGIVATGLNGIVATRLNGIVATRLNGIVATRLNGIVATRLLFIMTILRMDCHNVIRSIFVSRLNYYLVNVEVSKNNRFKSPTFDLLNAYSKLGLLNLVEKMANGSTPLIGKKKWSNCVWERAWRLGDAYWIAVNALNPECSMLTKILGKTRYLTWWIHADAHPYDIRMCETMSRNVCRKRLLKADDYRLKGSPYSKRTCVQCDMFVPEDIRHVVMNCPAVDLIRRKMYQEIYKISPRLEDIIQENPSEILGWLLGGDIPGMDLDAMTPIWRISGASIVEMYLFFTKGRSGIG